MATRSPTRSAAFSSASPIGRPCPPRRPASIRTLLERCLRKDPQQAAARHRGRADRVRRQRTECCIDRADGRRARCAHPCGAAHLDRRDSRPDRRRQCRDGRRPPAQQPGVTCDRDLHRASRVVDRAPAWRDLRQQTGPLCGLSRWAADRTRGVRRHPIEPVGSSPRCGGYKEIAGSGWRDFSVLETGQKEIGFFAEES